MEIAGGLRYEVIEGWEKLPAGMEHLDVSGVAVDSRDRVYLLTRKKARLIVYERDGTFVTAWGDGIFTERTHGLTIGPDDSVYSVDDGDHTVRKFTPDGTMLMMMGTPGVASDTGYDGSTIDSIKRGGPPFNRPTNVALAPNGDLYVSDGYGNARVHQYTGDGTFVRSWGEPGTGPGQFNLPHGIWVMPDSRVMVADRENDRIQFFSPSGEYLDQWTDVQRPTAIYIDRQGLVYVSELWCWEGRVSYVHGVNQVNKPGRVSIFDLQGNLLHRWGGEDPCAAGNFAAPHAIVADSRGDIYVAEVTHTFAVARGKVPPGCHTFQKFARQ